MTSLRGVRMEYGRKKRRRGRGFTWSWILVLAVKPMAQVAKPREVNLASSRLATIDCHSRLCCA
jgi:hypothetical protein